MTTIHTGGGAYIGGGVNTGGGDFVGRDKTVHGDDIRVGNMTGNTGVAIGRGAQATVNTTTGITGAELNQLFAPLMEAVRTAPPDKQATAMQTAEALKAETAKGNGANDNRLADLIEGLVDLVPGAVSAVVSAFTSPVLAAVAGPATQRLIRWIQRR
jgi:hypothetical protein